MTRHDGDLCPMELAKPLKYNKGNENVKYLTSENGNFSLNSTRFE